MRRVTPLGLCLRVIVNENPYILKRQHLVFYLLLLINLIQKFRTLVAARKLTKICTLLKHAHTDLTQNLNKNTTVAGSDIFILIQKFCITKTWVKA